MKGKEIGLANDAPFHGFLTFHFFMDQFRDSMQREGKTGTTILLVESRI